MNFTFFNSNCLNSYERSRLFFLEWVSTEVLKDSELGQNIRFGAPVSEEDLSLMIKQTENQNPKNNTKWAFNVFEKWRLSREGVVPELLNMNSDDMDFWLQRFIVEAHRKDGVEYLRKSLYLITCGLLRYLRDADVNDKNFLDEQNLNFCKFRKVLDARMKMLIEKGIGSEIKTSRTKNPRTGRIDVERKGVREGVGRNASTNHVFFYSAKLFGLRAYVKP